MDHGKARKSSTSRHHSSIPLLLFLLCWGATESWAAGTTRARPASNRRTPQQATPAPRAPNKTAVTDPCGPSASTMQTKAATAEPARNSASALASLVARTRGQESPAPSDPNASHPLALGLWSSRIAAPDPGDDAETSLALKRLIQRVHTMTLNDKSSAEPSTPSVPAASMAKPPTSVRTHAEAVEPPQAESATPAARAAAPELSPKAQKALEDLRRNPSRARDPLEIAEILFLSGRATDAVPFYEEALRRTGAGGAASGGDRAWILFQLGNCLRETDAAKAQDAYSKLIAEYPGSPWTEMARAGSQLLTWYQSTRPDQLTTMRKP